MNLSKSKIITLVIVFVAIVGLGFWAYKVNKGKGYSVVYLTTKEVYVGMLRTFPYLQLTEGYILTTVPDTTDPKKSNIQLTPMSEALWAPEGGIHLVKDNVIFYGTLSSD